MIISAGAVQKHSVFRWYMLIVSVIGIYACKNGIDDEKSGFRVNDRTKIYGAFGVPIDGGIAEAFGLEAEFVNKNRQLDIRFYGEDINKGNRFFRNLYLSLIPSMVLCSMRRTKSTCRLLFFRTQPAVERTEINR